jgi:hypothetical protein
MMLPPLAVVFLFFKRVMKLSELLTTFLLISSILKQLVLVLTVITSQLQTPSRLE